MVHIPLRYEELHSVEVFNEMYTSFFIVFFLCLQLQLSENKYICYVLSIIEVSVWVSFEDQV